VVEHAGPGGREAPLEWRPCLGIERPVHPLPIPDTNIIAPKMRAKRATFIYCFSRCRMTIKRTESALPYAFGYGCHGIIVLARVVWVRLYVG
jgi:hypothetical protein